MAAVKTRGEHQGLGIKRGQRAEKQSLVRWLFRSWTRSKGHLKEEQTLHKEQEGIGSWETGWWEGIFFLILLGDWGPLNILSINSFNLKVIMGSQCSFMEDCITTLFCFDRAYAGSRQRLVCMRSGEVKSGCIVSAECCSPEQSPGSTRGWGTLGLFRHDCLGIWVRY